MSDVKTCATCNTQHGPWDSCDPAGKAAVAAAKVVPPPPRPHSSPTAPTPPDTPAPPIEAFYREASSFEPMPRSNVNAPAVIVPTQDAHQLAKDAAEAGAEVNPYDLVAPDIGKLYGSSNIADVEAILKKLAMMGQVDPKRPVVTQILQDIADRGVKGATNKVKLHTWYVQAYADMRTAIAKANPTAALPLRRNMSGVAESIEQNLNDVFRSSSFGGMSFDEFRNEIQLDSSPTWHRSGGAHMHDEADYTRLAEHLQREYHFGAINENLLYRCIMAIAKESRVNVMRSAFEYAASIYDRRSRLDSWLIDYCGAEDNELNRVYGSRWLMGVVARVMTPGAQFDNVLCLEGGQGEGKTSLLRMLAGQPEYYCSFTGAMNDKDSLMKLRGKLIVEFAEGVTTRRTEQDEQKEFITRLDDEYRDPYGRLMKKHKRQFGLAMTTNQYEYLNDPSGARRMWGVQVGDIDLIGFKKVLPQIWGEAVARYQGGQRWWIDKTEPLLIAMQKEGAEDRRSIHPWELIIENWRTHEGHIISGRWTPQQVRAGGPITFVKNAGMLLREVMGMHDERLDRKHEQAMAGVLRAIGFENTKVRGEGLHKDVAPLMGWWHQSLSQQDRRKFAAQLIPAANKTQD